MIFNIFLQAGLYIGMTIVIMLLLHVRRHMNNLFLAGSLFTTWHALLLGYLMYSGLIIRVPELYRTAFGPAMLIIPLFYLYSRNTFYPGRLRWKWEWIIFIPTVVYFVDLSPFFLSSRAVKLESAQQLLHHPEITYAFKESLLFSKGVWYAFVYFWLTMWFVFQLRLLYLNRSIWREKNNHQNKAVFGFLLTLTIIYIPVVFPGNLAFVFFQQWFTMAYLSASLALTLITACVYLMFRPAIMYGFFPKVSGLRVVDRKKFKSLPVEEKVESLPADLKEEPEATEEEDPAEKKQERVVPVEKAEVLDRQIQHHLQQTRAYTKTGYSLYDLSKDTGIPVYQLSPLINQYHNTNYNTWINEYRIHHFLELAKKEENKMLTQEALAMNSGFGNRVTFSKAFRKQMGVTPTEYLQNQVFTN